VNRRWHLLLALVVLMALMAPMMLTDSTFGIDWSGHLWLVQMQARNISYLGHPSLFVQSSLGAFEPWFAFYGGTLYSLVAMGSVASGGHTLAVYVASYALALAMAYTGLAWIAKQIGLRGWTAHAPAFVFVTSAYYLTDVYARGAWPETVATSAIPLVIASGVSLLRTTRWRPLPVLAFLVSTVVFTGSHNLTLLYGTFFLIALCLAALIAFGRAALPSGRRVLGLAALGLLALGVNLWFLLPDAANQGHTAISHSFTRPPTIHGGMPLGFVLNPYRHHAVGTGGSTFDLQLPTLALVWSVVTLAFCWRDLAREWRRLAIALEGVGLLFFAPILFPGLWHALPKLLWAIQYPYRLLAYVDLCVAGLVAIATLTWIASGRGAGRKALVVAAALFALVEGGQAIHQEWGTPSSLPGRNAVFPGASKLPAYWIRFASYLEFQDVSAPVINATIPEIPGTTVYNGQGANVIPVPVTERPRSSYSVTFAPPHDGTVNTDVIAGSYLVAVHNAKIVGRTPYSEMVIAVKRNPDGGPTRVTFSTGRTWPIVLGQWASVASVIAIVALLAALTIRRARDPGRDGSSRGFPRRRPTS
jgi:hypothetical protein